MKRLLALLLILAPASLRGADPELVNGIAVIVNDAVITYKDVENSLREDIDFLQRRNANDPPLVLEQKVRELKVDRIEQLVEAHLILNEFKTGGFNLPESYIENRINEDIKKFGDRLTLTKTLQSEGMTYESYRTKVREKTIIDMMVHHKLPYDPTVSPTKIENYYVQNRDKFKLQDQVKLRMIVVTNRPNETAFSSAEMAKEILAKINDGVPFAEMAKIYSQGSQSGAGGDWGWVEKTVLRPELATVAFSLKPGQKSDVIETPEGCYLMHVEEIRVSYVKTLAEVRDEIEATLKSQETRRLRKQWIERLKTKSFVRYF